MAAGFSSTRGILTRYAKTRLGRSVRRPTPIIPCSSSYTALYSIGWCNRCRSLACFPCYGLLSHLEHSHRSRGTDPQPRLSKGCHFIHQASHGGRNGALSSFTKIYMSSRCQSLHAVEHPTVHGLTVDTGYHRSNCDELP